MNESKKAIRRRGKGRELKNTSRRLPFFSKKILSKTQKNKFMSSQSLFTDRIPFYEINLAHQILHEIQNKTSWEIICLLAESPDPINVTNLHTKFGCPQSFMSQKLLKIKETGLVNTERKGIEIYYSIDPVRFEKITSVVNQLSKLYLK